MMLSLRGRLWPREGAGQLPALSTFIECPSAALGRKRNGSADTTPPLGDLLFSGLHPHLGRVGAASVRRPAGHRGTGVDLGPGYSRLTRSSPHRWPRRAEGVGFAPGALARRLAMVSSGHTRTRCLLGCGSGDLHAIFWFVGGGDPACDPSGPVAFSAPFLADTDLHRRLGRGARLARVRAPAASHPLQRPGGQCGPWRYLGAVAPPPALDRRKRDVSLTSLATPLGPNGEVGSLHLGLPAHPRKRSNRHALSRGYQPVPRVAGSG